MKRTSFARTVQVSLGILLLTSVCVPATITPAASSVTNLQAQATQKKRIVVMDFDYGTTNSYYNSYRGVGAAKGISELLVNELVNNGTYTVVDRSKLEQVLKQQNRSGAVDAATAVEIGKQLGVDAVLIGTITRFNIDQQSGGGGVLGIGASSSKTKASVQIDARLISTSTGYILATAKGTGETEQGGGISVAGVGSTSSSSNEDALLSDAVDKAVDQMVKNLAEVASKIP